jgi:hypothetical protein
MLAMFFCDSDVEAKELCTGILSGVETRIFDCRREQILFFCASQKYIQKHLLLIARILKPIILLREYKEVTLIQVVGA